MAKIGTASIDVEARLATFETDMGRAARIMEREMARMQRTVDAQLGRINRSFDGMVRTVGTALKGFIGFLGARELMQFGIAVTNQVDRLRDLSKQFGVSTEQLSKFGYAARQNGSNMEQAAVGLGKFAQNVAAAAGGSEKAARAFDAIGVSVKDASGNLKSVDVLLKEVATRFAGYEDGAGKAALAVELFGRSGRELIPTLNSGAAGLEEFGKRASALGIVVTQDLADKADAFNDALSDMGAAATGAAQQILDQLLPSLTAAAESASAFIASVDWSSAFRAFSDGVSKAVEWLDELAVVIGVRIVATAIPALIAGIGGVVTALTTGTATVAAFGVALGGWPAIIGLAAGAIYYLATAETDVERATDAARDAIERLNKATGAGVQPAMDMAEAERKKAQAMLDSAKATLVQLEAQLRVQESMPNFGDGPDRRSQGIAVGLTQERAAQARADIEKLTATIEDLGKQMAVSAILSKTHADAMKALEGSHRSAAPIIDRTTTAAQEAAEALADWKRQQELHDRELMKADALLIKLRQNTDAYLDTIEGTIAGYEEEVHLLGLSDDARRSLEIQMRAEHEIREMIAKDLRGEIDLTDEQIAQFSERIRAGADMLDAAEREAAAAAPFRQAWEGAVGSVADAFGELVANGFRGWKGFLDSMLNALKQWVARVIAIMAQRALLNAFSGAGGGWAQALMSGLGGGGGFNVAGLFGGFGGGGVQIGGGVTGGIGAGGYANAGGSGLLGTNGGAGLGAGSLGFIGGGAMLGYNAYGGWPGAVAGGVLGLAAYGAIAGTATGAALGIGAGTAMAGAGAAAGGGLAGAAAGAAAIPVVGWVIAALAVIAMLAGVGKKHPELGVAAQGGFIHEGRIEGQATGPFGSVFVGKEDLSLSQSSQELAQAFVDFDKSIAAIMTSEEIARVTSALSNWQVHQEGDGIDPAKIFESRFNTIVAQFDPAIQAFTAAGATLEQKVERFGQALTVSRVFDDLGLDVDFAEFLDLAREAQLAGEEFGDTVNRLVESTHLIGDAFDLLGIETGEFGAEFIKFSADVVAAIGGIDKAKESLERILGEFYTPTERAQQAMDDAQATAVQELADIGLDPTITKEQFRDLFEAMLRGTPTPEMVAQWVEAGVALANATDAQDAYNDSLEEAERVAQAAAQAGVAYGFAVADMQNELVSLLSGFAPSQFVQDLAAIRVEEFRRAQELNRLAIAAGNAAAAESDLTLVHQIAAVKAAQAIARLRAAAQSLVNQLYGPNAIGSSATSLTTGAITSLDSTAADLFRSWEDALKSIRKFLDDILLDEQLTTLTPQQQLNEAQRQFDDTLARAMAGDADAAAALPTIARELLDNARDFWASGDQYDAIFAAVMSGMQGVLGRDNPGTPDSPGGVDVATLEQATLEAEAAAEEVRQQRLLMAVELAGYLRDLADALGQSVFALAADMGLKLNEFIRDLGIDLASISTETATQLAAVANTLGVELAELTDELGISLGALADANSYLNDALEAAINAQPPEIRSELGPLLTAIETATTDADANAAIAALETAVNGIGGATAIALAPFLDDVDMPGIDDQLAALDRIGDAANEFLPSINAWLAQIAINTGAQVPIDTSGGEVSVSPSALSTFRVQSDESTTPKAFERELLAELKASRQQNAALNQTLRQLVVMVGESKVRSGR